MSGHDPNSWETKVRRPPSPLQVCRLQKSHGYRRFDNRNCRFVNRNWLFVNRVGLDDNLCFGLAPVRGRHLYA